MRLKSIQVAGFKSFAERTVISFPDAVTAVVGPNGCGKSNIVDALRWAIGERSARLLRANTIQDVIFNGTDNRVAATSASVELLFDNSDGRIGGEYSAFSEISVRRELDLDQQSDFYLNGNRCRSRDIQSVFLGTGFGTKGYALIEQGMISQLVQSRPEEIRQFLEEAAGVSSYRERRRETELKLERTRQNVLRVSDEVQRLSSDLRGLRRQVREFNRFEETSARIGEVKIQLLTHKVTEKGREEASLSDLLLQQQTERERQSAEIQKYATKLVELRETEHVETEKLNRLQRDVYATDSRISTLTDQVKAKQDGIREQRQLQERYSALLSNVAVSQTEANSEIDDLRLRLQAVEEAITDLAASVHSLQEIKSQVEERERSYLAQISQQQSSLFDARQLVRSLTDTSQILDDRIDTYDQRLGYLQGETELSDSELATLESLAGAVDKAKGKLETADQRSAAVQGIESRLVTMISDLDPEILNSQQRVSEIEGSLTVMHAEHDALLRLGEESIQVKDWAHRKFGAVVPRLTGLFEVDPEWTVAAELVLGSHLGGIVVSSLEDSFEELQRITDGSATLVSKSADVAKPNSLTSKVRKGREYVAPFLGQVLCANSRAEAESIRLGLKAGESVITSDGWWLGPNWVIRTPKGRDDASALVMSQKIAELKERLAKAHEERSDLRRQRETFEKKLEQARGLLSRMQAKRVVLVQLYATAVARHDAQRKFIADAQERFEAIRKEKTQLNVEKRQDESKRLCIKDELVEAERELAAAESEYTRLSGKEHSIREAVIAAVNEADTEREKLADLRLERANIDSRINALVEAREKEKSREQELTGLREAAIQTQEGLRNELPSLQTELSSTLDKKVEIDTSFSAQRNELSKLEGTVRSTEAERATAEAARANLDADIRESKVKLVQVDEELRTLKQDLVSLGADPDSVLEELESDLDVQAIQTELDQLNSTLASIGPINQRAVIEFEEKQEQKTSIEDQLQDLNRAVETLTSAIRRIDNETKSQLQSTFDKINGNLAHVFPRLFGGGRAMLELTGESFLDSGVVIRATPPGKRNLPIGLLSGGERAMTALAFVFAVFQINPSPVCVLDEVDAPLDEANVKLFMALLRDYAPSTQFIVVTHNQGTMAHADVLMGVTMQESGVSRVVEVELAQALADIERASAPQLAKRSAV